MQNLWHILLYQPLVNGLIFFYNLFGHNLGLAIIALTGAIRLILNPLTSSSMKMAKKMQELAPELESLKAKHGTDKQAMSQAQLGLYKQHGVNPASGCLPQIVQLVIFIALFNAFSNTLKANGNVAEKLNQLLYPPLRFSKDAVLNTRFLYLDLSRPDVVKIPNLPFPLPGLLVIAAAVTQFISSKKMLPQAKKSQSTALATPGTSDDMAAVMQTQMLYMFPIMTLVIGISFPSGLALYWFVFSLLSLTQQFSKKTPAA